MQAHGDVILVSDQIFRIFPFDRLRKYHRMEIAHAVFATVADAAVRAHEAPSDRDRTAGVLAAYLTDVYTRAEFQYVEYFRELLLAASTSSPRSISCCTRRCSRRRRPTSATSTIATRSATASRASRSSGPGPRLLYNKLLDLVGPAALSGAGAQASIDDRTPLAPRRRPTRSARDLGWFWPQWLGRVPRVNYRLDAVRVTPRAGRRARRRSTCGARARPIREPVEVQVDRSRGRRADAGLGRRRAAHTVRGRSAAPGWRRSRSIRATAWSRRALGSLPAVDDPRMDNRQPPRWRLLYEGAGALFNISQTSLNFAVGMLAKPQHDLRHHVELSAYHNETSQIGVAVNAGYGFGQQADRNNLTSVLLRRPHRRAPRPVVRRPAWARCRRPGGDARGRTWFAARHARLPVRSVARGRRSPSGSATR